MRDSFDAFYQNKRVFTRYIRSMIRHMTFRRFVNLCRVEAGILFGAVKARGLPYQLIIDPTNVCQLKCPLCLTGLRNRGRPAGKMSLSLFQKALDELKTNGLHVFLHNWGEPLLNENIVSFIEAAAKADLGTTMSSNLSMDISPELAERIVLSGLETLVVSLDGISSESYAIYRVGGDFDRVLSNVKLISAKKKALKRKFPIIEWQFLMLKHNENEIVRARGMFRKLGFDSIFFAKANLPENRQEADLASKWLPSDPRRRASCEHERSENIGRKCWWLWRAVVIDCDGGVSPCCFIDDDKTDFGNISSGRFPDIWNGPHYRSARSLFGGKRSADSVPTVCEECVISKRRNEK